MANPLNPPSMDTEDRVLGWVKEACEEGEAFLKSQTGYVKINDAIGMIMGDNYDLRSSTLSGTTINLVGKVATDLTALCTDVKPFWEYQTKNEHFKRNVEIQGDLATHWWTTRNIDMKNADSIRYSLCAGTGWSHIVYNPNIEDIDCVAEDPRDILPIRPPSTSFSIQEAFGVIIRAQRTVNYVRALYPTKADYIQADRDGSMISSLANTRAGRILDKLGSPFRERLFGNKPVKTIPRVPTVDLYTIYLHDNSTNKSDSPMYMGQFDEDKRPRNNWSYIVEKGEPIYPRGRCIVCTNTVILYDGPNIYWHGMFPLAKLTLDPWPWTWLGKAVLWDILPIQNALNRVMRCVDDQLEKVARPDVIADKNSISRAELERIDTRKAGQKFRQNPMGGKGLTIQPPPPLPPEVYKVIEYYESKIYEIPGVRDMSSLMKLNQIPAPETIDRIQESMSPSVRLRSRVIEAYMRDFATMVGWDIAQFYDLPSRLAILGEKGAVPEDFDLDPQTFIPAYVAPEDFGPEGMVTEEAMRRGPLPRYDRAKQYFKQISYNIAPSSLLNASEIERQLKYLQLARAGLIDHWTLLEVLDIPNVGEPPAGAKTITERLMLEQRMGLAMIVSSAGRKSSGQEPPQQKTSGAVSESG